MTEPNPLVDKDYFEDEEFSKLDLAGGSLGTEEFSRCVFKRCDWREIKLNRCAFEECRFEDCDLSLAKLNQSSFREVVFRDVKLVGVDWTEAVQLLFEVTFERCKLDYGVFIEMGLKYLRCQSCSAKEVNYTDADLTGVVFKDTDLTRAEFAGANLTDADLSQAKGYQIDPRITRTKNTKFSLEGVLTLASLFGLAVPELARE